MDKILTLLQSLLSLNKVASVSLPGLFFAVGLAMILWPPPTKDKIPNVVNLVSPPLTEKIEAYLTDKIVVPKERACEVEMHLIPTSKGLGDLRSTQVDNQLLLDRQKDKIAQCIEIETSRKGFEKTQNDYLALDIVDLQKLLTAALDTYSNYEKSDNPLAARFKAKAKAHQDEIQDKRKLILKNEQSMRNRDLYLAELARYDKIISDRLADPGRLRPRKTFDDLLASFVNHVVALVLLAIALGVVLTPLNQFASAGFFDHVFPEGY